MYCNKCGAENPDDSQFCAKCGNKLKNFNEPLNVEKGSVQQKKSNRNKIVIAGIVVLVVILFIVGIVLVGINNNTASGNSTFTINDVSFNFPNNFVNTTAPPDFVSGSSDWKQDEYLLDNKSDMSINVQSNSNPNGFTLDEFLIADEASVKNNNGTVISTTNLTNPNGVVVAGEIDVMNDLNNNKVERYYEMIFSDPNGTFYGITVQGEDSDNAQIQQVQQTVFNSLKIS